MFNKKTNLIIIVLLLSAMQGFCEDYVLNPDGNNILPVNVKLHENDYVNAYCPGKIEYKLKDKTRIDCYTKDYACEFDWAHKWYEGVGQALWYAHCTGKKPCLVLILKNQNDYLYFNRAKILCEKYGIKLIEVKSKDFI